MAGIIPIKVNNLIQATQYTVLGKDDELAIVYKGNGKEYVIENYTGDEKYTLSSNFIEKLFANKDKKSIDKYDVLKIIK